MVLKIIRKAPTPAATIPAAPAPSPPPKPASKAALKQDAVNRWKDFPPPNAQPKTCAYCGRDYIRTCSEVEHPLCANYQWVQKHPRKEAKA